MDILVISKNDNKNNWINSKDIDNNINVNFYFIESFDDLNKIKTIDLMKLDAFFIDVTEMEEKTFDKIKQYYFDNKEPPFAFYGGYHCTIDIYDIPHITISVKIIKLTKYYIELKDIILKKSFGLLTTGKLIE